MSIKGDKAVSGEDISTLAVQSHKIVIKICDECGTESEARFKDIYKGRLRRNSNKDYCHKCSRKIQGIKKRKGKLLLAGGYFQDYDENGKRVPVHRIIMEKHLNRKLSMIEMVHHINGNKKDNSLSNLIVAEDESRHQKMHSSLQEQAFKLVQAGLIKFDRTSQTYYIDLDTMPNYIPLSLGFDDIGILQNKNICRSRLDVNTDSEVFRGLHLRVPLIASNMSSVISAEFYIKLYNLGALGVMHRALPDDQLVLEIGKVAKECSIVCASIGVGDGQFELAKKLVGAGANVMFIDVAHGYSDFVIDLGKKIKNEFSDIKVVLGNTINTDMMFEVCDFADAIKVGIANGFACKTRNTAACNEKQFTSVLKFKSISKQLELPIISDGGIRECADFTKAIAAGANSVMAGSIFARCPESAAETVEVEGVRKRIYAGMASRLVQDRWKSGVKTGTCTEGKVRYLDIGEPVEDLIERYLGALKSGITYAGTNNILDFQKLVKFVRV